MADAEKNQIERELQQGMEALHEALRGIDNETAITRPHPECWSVLECVEHIRLAETGLLSRLKEAAPSTASHEDPARETKFAQLAMNRARRIEAPETVTPTHHWPTLAEAVGALDAARSETLRWLEAFEGDLRSWLAIHPLISRPVNCYEMLLLMALHPRRHAQQIVEIREHLLRPRSPME